MKVVVELETDKLKSDALIQIIMQMDDGKDLKELARHYIAGVRAEVASSPYTLPEDLDFLSKDDNFIVRWCVAANPNAPESALLRLAIDPEFLIRERVFEKHDLSDKVILAFVTGNNHDRIYESAMKEAKRRHLKI